MRNLKKIALYNATKKNVLLSEVEDFVKEWWSQKYNLPTNHPLLLDRHLEDLLIEYYTDLFRKDEKAVKSFQAELDGRDLEEEHEDWLKKEMGDDYITEEEQDSEWNDKY